ncbi:hypothetical protein ACFO1B_44020 [Dactylosporangium siamense]|uniref:Uncharacterized protein n=1 Tax=Dactylosporangium siamense TaxID=685454 RepID=A0A919PY45_9ACTN|nr:hypothetical protein [Dactylosporangium siamense]GIG52905.1 hypothetical protein Dsi01nite_109460 [Dactylosporangium siamense]
MASRGVNTAVARLREVQAAQRRAAAVVGRRQADVSAVAERRAAVLAQLGQEATETRAALDVALVVLADLVGDATAAGTADVPVTEVRAARRRADRDAVRAADAAVREGGPRGGSGTADDEGGDE